MHTAFPLSLALASACLFACTIAAAGDGEGDGTETHSEHDGDPDTTDTTGETPEGALCQPELQDCPDDYKCVLRLGAEDWTFACLPVLGEQGAGEVCTHDGVIAGTDDCDQDTWCIGAFDPNGAPWSGLCYPLCVAGGCGDQERCVGIGGLPVCARICDPLTAGSCGGDEACIYRAPEGFVCFPAGAEGEGLGEPCATAVSCAAGLHCAQRVAGCGPDDYCCTDYCDVDEDVDTCAAKDLGAVCEPIGASDPSQAHVGACVVPG